MKLGGPKLSQTVKGKLSLGARVIQQGGRENMLRQIFGMREGEEMLKASQCYLSTTAGPIAGLLFISTEKIGFCSERPITIPSPTGHLIRTPYKVFFFFLGGGGVFVHIFPKFYKRVKKKAKPICYTILNIYIFNF